tara:strand:+ start:6107 stop:7870 length:1764 start_codon:yes stop_codon:yes gene_type:complete
MRLWHFLSSILIFISVTATTAFADDAKAFHRLLQEHWDRSQQEQIFFHMDPDAWRMNGKLPDVSPAGFARRKAYNEQTLERLAAIDPAALPAEDHLSYRIFHYERQLEQAYYDTPEKYFPIARIYGYHTYFAHAPGNMSFLTREDYEKYLISLADYPRYNREYMDLLQEAVDKGYTQPCVAMQNYETTIRQQIVDKAESSVFFDPFRQMPATIPAAEQDELRTRARKLILDRVVPAYEAFYEFYTRTYIPNCRKDISIASVPGGADYYRYAVRFFTTTDMTPKEIHKLGLNEVKRIRAEMEDVIHSVGFKGNLPEFLQYLRTEKRFYAESGEDLLEKVALLIKRMDGKLPQLFGYLPRQPFTLRPIPEDVAEGSASAFYVPSSGDGTTPGIYYLNTSKLDSRPLYALEALTYHEAMPGHHLQNAIAQEKDLPPFRRILNHSAFTEGWGLYAERLGLDAGLYQDPYNNFGRLSAEMFRACRLVVDTGMHALSWSREQAIDFMTSNSGISVHDATAEIDRYITWPAQALSYKIGELKIRELRGRAEQALGAGFDIRAFHDKLLENASMPLSLLEEEVMAWIKAQKTPRK